MQYIQKLKEIRKKYGDTQTKTAKILKTTQPQYQLYESGKRPMPIETLKIFCEHYNVSADYILGLKDKEE